MFMNVIMNVYEYYYNKLSFQYWLNCGTVSKYLTQMDNKCYMPLKVRGICHAIFTMFILFYLSIPIVSIHPTCSQSANLKNEAY